MGGILSAIRLSSQGLSVQRSKMNTVAKNIANAETTETKDGQPYRRQRVVVSEAKDRSSFHTIMQKANSRLAHTNSRHIAGKTAAVVDRSDAPSVDSKVVSEGRSSFKVVYDPSHPNADESGYVKMPNVEIVTEMVDMMAASRAYEANTVAISSAKEMAKKALEI
jgi:flagellar basal-body rod protein FlgC